MMVYAPNCNTGLNDDPRGDAIAVFAFDGIEFLHFRQDAGGGLVEGEDLWNRCKNLWKRLILRKVFIREWAVESTRLASGPVIVQSRKCDEGWVRAGWAEMKRTLFKYEANPLPEVDCAHNSS